MPHVQKHAPGSFNWLELGTTDQAAAKQFYGSLFGWEAQDFPMGPDGVYTMFKLDGKDVGACYRLGPQMKGVPPNWGLYVAVEDADAAAKRAAELGGALLKPPFDVYTFGRMAVLQDPTGAIIHMWQPKTHIGTGITGENGTLCWADLNTPDRQRAKSFYEQLFGWKFSLGKDKAADGYLHIQNGEEYIGGIPPESGRNKYAPPSWLIYFQAGDCDASTEKAKELGARVYVPPMTIEKNLRFSVIADPQGAAFALFTSVR
jgi:predicted enzyme related to lactoylglutathione lyase